MEEIVKELENFIFFLMRFHGILPPVGRARVAQKIIGFALFNPGSGPLGTKSTGALFSYRQSKICPRDAVKGDRKRGSAGTARR
jgi:hypothetical protein